MKLGEFIKNFSHNNVIRLLYKHKGGHEVVLDNWNDVSMDWEVNQQKGKFRHFINNEVLGLATISFMAGQGIHHSEALNIVIERLDDQPLLDEIKDDITSYSESILNEEMNLQSGVYLIKANDKDYSLTEERENGINLLNIDDEHKDFFKNIFKDEPTPKSSDLLVEIVGQNPFLTIKSIKNYDTGEDITERYLSKDGDDINTLWTLTKDLEWILQ